MGPSASSIIRKEPMECDQIATQAGGSVEGQGNKRARTSERRGELSSYRNSIMCFIWLRSDFATTKAGGRRKNARGSIGNCHPHPHPSPAPFLPGRERKQVYWQAGLGAGDNNVGFVPRWNWTRELFPPPNTTIKRARCSALRVSPHPAI